jgi:hypothetical protein
MQKYIFTFIVFIIVVVLGVISILIYNSNWIKRIESRKEEYGFPLNQERKKNCIPIIENSWYTKDLSYERSGFFKLMIKNKVIRLCQTWSDFKSQDKPYHKQKAVCRLSENDLDTEVDIFENRINDTLIYQLEVTYYYGIAIEDADPWVYKFRYLNPMGKDYPYKVDLIEQNQYDSVMLAWKLNIN